MTQVGDVGFSFSAANQVGGPAECAGKTVLDPATTDAHIHANFPTAALRFIAIVVDNDCTLKTNDATTPDDTFSLRKDEPFVWVDNAYFPCPFSVDVVAFFVTTIEALTFRVYYIMG